MAHTLLIVGGGKMGSALLGGLLTSGWVTPEQVAVSETSAERREELEQEFPGIRVIDAPEAPVSATDAAAHPATPTPPPPEAPVSAPAAAPTAATATATADAPPTPNADTANAPDPAGTVLAVKPD